MESSFVSLHKSKHLLAHVLAAAGARRWPGAALGESGETARGFYADFGLAAPPDAIELGCLSEEMARVLTHSRVFSDVRLSPREAHARFAGQPWKQKQVAVLAELGRPIACYELDGFLDLCDCAIKSLQELRAVHPEKFMLVGTAPAEWRDRAGTHRYVRVTGELFPAPPPCGCCPG